MLMLHAADMPPMLCQHTYASAMPPARRYAMMMLMLLRHDADAYCRCHAAMLLFIRHAATPRFSIVDAPLFAMMPLPPPAAMMLMPCFRFRLFFTYAIFCR